MSATARGCTPAGAAQRLGRPARRAPPIAARPRLPRRLSLALRAIHARFWIDEGLSVGIASHPLSDIPGVLREDGSPPLYYLILKLWMSVFGSGEADTHALSVAFAIFTVPAAWLGARALFGDRAAWIAALLAAINPFLTYYSQERGCGPRRSALHGGAATFVVPSSRAGGVAARFPSPWRCSLRAQLGPVPAIGTVAALVHLARSRRPARRGAHAPHRYATPRAHLPWLPRPDLPGAAHRRRGPRAAFRTSSTAGQPARRRRAGMAFALGAGSA
jgi:hypothetical protein